MNIIKMFADDIKIYLEVVNQSDFQLLQQSINLISNWAASWQLNLSISKCHHMRVTLSRTIATHDYLLNNVLLTSCNYCRDLGIDIDSHLSFNKHINCIVAKAHLRSSQILRCFLSRDPFVLSKAFVTYVRPLLEYCSPVWSPCGVGCINKIESVQRQFTKKLKGMFDKSYEERLAVLGLERLELRRLHSDLVMCFKVLHGLANLEFDDYFEYSNAYRTRGHSFKLHVLNSRINVRHNFFSVRVVNVWNSLPSHVVDSASVKLFATLLKDVNFKHELLGKL